MSRPSDLISTCEVAALVLVVGVELHEVSSLVLWLHGPTFRDDIHGHTPPYALPLINMWAHVQTAKTRPFLLLLIEPGNE